LGEGMSNLKVYNSYSRQKEAFVPLTPNHVGMYVCGPTVSGESHLGHARGFITFDVIYRYLLYLGYKVRYVRNITDAGHFEEEGREAEDKISQKAVIEKMEPMELVQKYSNLFHWAMKQFNNLEPSIEPAATGHIIEQIDMIKKIMEAGYAYAVNGSVYFDVKKYAEHYPYGKLSGRKLDDLLEATRELESQEEKRNRQDFALWKSASPGHIMRWTSPWGEGFPGWHIECSAMSTKYLGTEFDIHGGGMDLMFPHHESEIAQSTICNHHVPARYWLHNNMITINGRKMGKSYNNVITLTDMFSGNSPLLAQAYHPMTIRFFILQTQYRSTLDFGNEALQAAEKGFTRLWDAYTDLGKMISDPGKLINSQIESQFNSLCREFDDFMNDDFNTAKVLANMFVLVNHINSFRSGDLEKTTLSPETLSYTQTQFKSYLEDVLGLTGKTGTSPDRLGGIMDLLIEIRKEARAKKDYQTSDRIRKQLLEIGILLKDEKDGRVSYTLE
jgi:cysteinyl-tRNA synthetase